MSFRMNGTLFAPKQSALTMAKIIVKYLGVRIEDDPVDQSSNVAPVLADVTSFAYRLR
jgi:hypothetical protein